MFAQSPFLLGILLIFLGVSTSALVFFLLRVAVKRRSYEPPPIPKPFSAEWTGGAQAIVWVRTGGKVVYANQQAREWFGLKEAELNLERLTQRTRPKEVFLGLCASEGQARFSIDGRLVEGSSCFLPLKTDPDHKADQVGAVLVVLRRPQVSPAAAGEIPRPVQALEIFAELSQSMAASLSLETTLQAILESVERLIPSDFPEITIWNTDEEHLIPYRLSGFYGDEHRVEQALERYQPDKGYSGYLIAHRIPLMIEDVDAYDKARPAIDRKQYPFNSYLGVPLLVAGELVGTLELASIQKAAFTQDDLEVLRILSGQAAVALHNAVLFQEEQRRILELTGLAHLSQAVSALGDTQDLIARLVESIAPLFDVKTLGFWIYDERRRLLQAQSPFIGIPTQFVELYRTEISSGSPAEDVWLSQEMIVAQVAPQDPKLAALGLDSASEAAGIVHTVLAPLKSVGRPLGYLQVADKKDGSTFDQDDLRILTIVTGQAASILENAALVRQSQERAQRAEALRRIASLTGSIATLDEILAFSLRELARLMRADMAAICLLDETVGELRLHRESLFGIPEDLASQVPKTQVSDPRFRTTVTGSQQPYITGNAQEDLRSLNIYRPIIDSLAIQSIINVPVIVRDQSVGEMILGTQGSSFFDSSDMILVSTTASQLASAIERSVLYTQTDESLRRRVEQLEALTRISRELNIAHELDYLLQLVYDEALKTTQADCGTIILFELGEDIPDTPRVMMSIGDPLDSQLTPVEQRAWKNEEVIVVEDFEHPGSSQPDLYTAPHDGVRSAIVVPIANQGWVSGLIHLHSRQPGKFDDPSQEITQSLAVQAAIAVGNAQRYQEQLWRSELLNRRVDAMTKLLETSQALQIDRPLELLLEDIAYAIQESTPFDAILVSIYNPDHETLVRISGAGIPLEMMRELQNHPQPWTAVEQLLKPEYRSKRAYFIPADKLPLDPPGLHTVVIPGRPRREELGDLAWDPEDLLIAPLLDAAGQPLGLISVDSPRNGLRPDRLAIEALEVFAGQAALVVESYQKVQDLSWRAEKLQRDLESARQSAQETSENLPVLLRKDLEQSQIILHLHQRERWAQAGLDIVEDVHQKPGRTEALVALGQGLLSRMGMDFVLLAELSDGEPRLLHVLGELPEKTNLEALLGQRNPLRSCLQKGELLLIADLEENPGWKESNLLRALEARSFICLPLTIEGEAHSQVDAAVLAASRSPMESMTADDEQMFRHLSHQVGFVLQNLHLIDETSRRLREVNLVLEYSRKLSTLDPTSILNTLIESLFELIPAVQVGMVALWDPGRGYLVPQIALGYSDNQKMMEILYHAGEALPGSVFESGELLRIGEVDFLRDYNLSPENLLRYRDGTGGRLPVSCMVVPLQTAESRLGVIVLDNFTVSDVFSPEDQVLVTSLAHQTALTLENARLFQASEQRARQLQALTFVAGTITSSLQSDELIRSLLEQLIIVLPYDTGTLWLRQGDWLTIRAARGFEDSEERVGISLEVADSALFDEMVDTGKPISVGDVRQDERFPALLEHRYLSWLGGPLISKGEVIGVIALEKTEAHFYSIEHLQTLVTFSGQAAVALDNARLYEDSLRRAAELDQRTQRLVLLNRLSSELSASLDLETILNITLQELSRAVPGSKLTAILFDYLGKAWLQAEYPQVRADLPSRVTECPFFERLRQSLGIFSTEDISRETDLAPLLPFLSEYSTVSLLVLPLATGNELHGLLFIHTPQTHSFSPDEIELARTISNQAAVAVQNARLYTETERLFGETQQRSAELSILFNLGMSTTQVLDLDRLVDITFENVSRLLQSDAVALVLVDESGELKAITLERGERSGPFAIPRSGASLSEFVLTSQQPLLIGDLLSEPENLPAPGYRVGDPSRAWLGVPLVARGNVMGVLSVQNYEPGVYHESHLRLLEQMGNQLAVAFDNARLFSTVQSYTADLEQRVFDRAEQLAREHKRTQSLLSIITELSSSLDMDLVLNRTLDVLNTTTEADHSLIMLMQPDEETLFLRAELGYTTLEYNDAAPSQLASWVIANRRPVLIVDLEKAEQWVKPDGSASSHRSAMAVPLMLGEETLGALLMFHRQPGRFSEDQLELVQATAKQIAVTINNAQLYNLIRDQAERLGDMLRTQHIETSRSQAILEAVADGVLVTDARREITLFNASAEKILGLNRQQVMGNSLEHFAGLFGKAAQSWFQTIQKWSQDPANYKPGDTYAEQIILDNRRVVAVHLSPVRLRNDFLGTVSIFRDITHQVEVDRLKSEFVATVSHELRTPMTSIKGYVEVLLMGAAGGLSDKQCHFLEIVKSNTERLTVLVNDLLDISRIEAGKITLSMQPLDLRELVDEATTLLKQRIREENRPMKVTVNIPSGLPAVFGDQERLRQVLVDLLENAFQYTPAGGHIWVRARKTRDMLRVDVKDDGIGIPLEDQPHVFERFYRGEDPLVLATSGTGLGLSIVQKLVEMHQGRIWLKSAGIPGKGSTFSFTIPFYKPNRETG